MPDCSKGGLPVSGEGWNCVRAVAGRGGGAMDRWEDIPGWTTSMFLPLITVGEGNDVG